jgi:Holliday junction resolvase
LPCSKKITGSELQEKISKQLESEGWYVINLISTNRNGIPDLMAIKNGVSKFIEIKGSGDRLSSLQRRRIKELRAIGCEVLVIGPAGIIEDTAVIIYDNLGF